MAKAVKESTEAVVKVSEAKVTKFISDCKYLFVTGLNIQFKGGKYETSNEAEIAYLKTLANVKIAE